MINLGKRFFLPQNAKFCGFSKKKYCGSFCQILKDENNSLKGKIAKMWALSAKINKKWDFLLNLKKTHALFG